MWGQTVPMDDVGEPIRGDRTKGTIAVSASFSFELMKAHSLKSRVED